LKVCTNFLHESITKLKSWKNEKKRSDAEEEPFWAVAAGWSSQIGFGLLRLRNLRFEGSLGMVEEIGFRRAGLGRCFGCLGWGMLRLGSFGP
jgi:hypothetical protein